MSFGPVTGRGPSDFENRKMEGSGGRRIALRQERGALEAAKAESRRVADFENRA
jgi:hypothetical protein